PLKISGKIKSNFKSSPILSSHVGPVSRHCIRDCHYCATLGFRQTSKKIATDHLPKSIPCNWPSLPGDRKELAINQEVNEIFIHCRDLAACERVESFKELANKGHKMRLILDGYAEHYLDSIIELLRHPNVLATIV